MKHVPGRFLDEDEDSPPSPEQKGNYFEGSK